MKSPVSITFEEPHIFEGKEITSVTMQPPKRKHDMQAVQMGGNDELKKEAALFAVLCNQTMECILELESCNYLQLQEAYRGFLGGVYKRQEALALEMIAKK